MVMDLLSEPDLSASKISDMPADAVDEEEVSGCKMMILDIPNIIQICIHAGVIIPYD